MFQTLSERLTTTINHMRGRGRLTEENIQDTLREIRIALLEADVALPVTKQFIERIREKALGEKVLNSLTPGQVFVKIVNDELTDILGQATAELLASPQMPTIILIAGLQGSGKTTSIAKLARRLKAQKKHVLVTSTDVYRPAAIAQLETLANQVDVAFYPSDNTQKPINIALNAIESAKKQFIDVVIIDTAGRLHIDEKMMDEIKQIQNTINPTETLFVIDSMTGQDAINTAKAFNDHLSLTGVILTKTDGDARGGAALSVWHTIGKPIKFMGVGEKMDALEPFHPKRMASRILGMGDVVSFVEEVEQTVDRKQAEKVAQKLKKGKKFTLEDFLAQLEQMGNIGNMKSLLGKLPGMGNMTKMIEEQAGDKKIKKLKAIIQSMTIKERRYPDLIQGTRKQRIAKGSGTQPSDVNKLIKQFSQAQKMMKRMKGMMGNKNMAGMMDQFKNMMPPGGLPHM